MTSAKAPIASAFVEKQRPEHPVLLMCRDTLTQEAHRFLAGFPGTVLYAVKCNSDSAVLRCLMAAGIRDFDVASLPELQLVKSIDPQARCYFNHPVKTAASIGAAWHDHQVTDFVVDCEAELDKVLEVTGSVGVLIQLRLKAAPGSKVYDFSTKFGMPAETAVTLARRLVASGVRWALSFHVGSQCEVPAAYEAALEVCAQVIAGTGAQPEYVNVGGGFPAQVPGRDIPPPEKFFEQIKATADRLHLPRLLCEPGRGLVWRAGKLAARVMLRNDHRLYLNDGVYGAMSESNYAKFPIRAELLRHRARPAGEARLFKLFGPTCDSCDAQDELVMLPDDVSTGDWLLIDDMGAYSTCLTACFNGFSSDRVELLDAVQFAGEPSGRLATDCPA